MKAMEVEKITNYLETAKQIILSQIELFNSYLTQVYLTINQNSIILLKKEIEYLKFIIKIFSKVNNEEIYQLIVMFEDVI